MIIKVCEENISIQNRAEPVIEISSRETEDRTSTNVVEIDVVGANGKIARFWVDLSVHNNRPEVRLKTQDAKKTKVRTVRVKGSFNIDRPTHAEQLGDLVGSCPDLPPSGS
jgi:hypothetical protein